MLLINNVMLPLDADFGDIKKIAASQLKTGTSGIKSACIYRKSVDARHKNDIRFCCSLLVDTGGGDEALLNRNKNASVFSERKYLWRTVDINPGQFPVVAGFGPAGMFAALTLARAGLCPLVLERGSDVDTRAFDVSEFFSGGKLKESSNVQFGEGGAGTFSDGKLNSGIKDPRCRTVLECFVKFGAPADILTDAKPHIGTDVLAGVVKNIRKEIISLGGKIRFNTCLTDIEIKSGKVNAVIAGGEKTECRRLILASGHSARDTFALLKEKNIAMAKKPFAVGLRIEHLQSDINRAMYGGFASHPALPAADYKLAAHLASGRGVYTFCMCPGGEVINSSSEQGGIAVNGMSRRARNGVNANSALLVGVEPEDTGEDILSGCLLQREIEKKAYEVASGAVPVETVGGFLNGKPDITGRIKPTVKPETVKASLGRLFPAFVSESLKEGIVLLDRKLTGFADSAAILTAPETRSSSPVRVLRNEQMESVNLEGLYPCGEGAGYAGGIMSAAVDGMKAAEAVIESYK